MIIAIDGPSGAGKSTLGKMLAEHLDLLYIDSGAMYRAVALLAFEAGIDPTDSARVAELVAPRVISLSGPPKDLRVTVDNRDVTNLIRSPHIGQAASSVSSIPEVRKMLVAQQQELGRGGKGCVMDGRDIGTVVFPDADVKFFLTADAEARAQRRFAEDSQRGTAKDLETTLAEINIRDARDINRTISPLIVADDAIEIDTSGIGIEETFNAMVSAIRKHS
jgi:cytidylate kinase